MTQTARPHADIANNLWTTAPLWGPLHNGLAVTSESPIPAGGDSFTVSLDPLAWPGEGPQALSATFANVGTATINATLALLQGDTIIASTTVAIAGSQTQVVSLQLTQEQIDAITVYGNLRAFARVTGSNGTSTCWTTAGQYSWTVPSGVTTAVFECWGGGGAGGGRLIMLGAMGGGGGGYSRTVLKVTPGDQYEVSVGAGGADQNDGEDSTISNTPNDPECKAKGGKVTGGGTTGGPGGKASEGIGDIRFSGGDGGSATGTTAGGAGGGSSAGPGSNGNNGTSFPGAVGTPGGAAVPGGGAGGNGGNGGSSGTAGSAPGGAGGGGGDTGFGHGGPGADGKCCITWS